MGKISSHIWLDPLTKAMGYLKITLKWVKGGD